jgi:hypothetical protein
MLDLTNYTISNELLQTAISSLPNIDSRIALNEPSGDFFTDHWVIKPEFKGTVWEEILNSLPLPKGEARLIKLAQGECYPSHADVDDRWHMNLTGNNSFIIDLEKQQMHQTNQLGHWYNMNAGVRHTAANFGSEDRVQLVIRQLLPRASITNPKQISLKLKTVVGDRRFIFDDVISPWLNRAFKQGIVSNFVGQDLEATFIIEESHIAELDKLINQHFTLTTK